MANLTEYSGSLQVQNARGVNHHPKVAYTDYNYKDYIKIVKITMSLQVITGITRNFKRGKTIEGPFRRERDIPGRSLMGAPDSSSFQFQNFMLIPAFGTDE